MTTRKEMKAKAKKGLKKHYLIFVIACLIGSFLGTESAGSLSIITSYDSSIMTDSEDINSIPAGKEGAYTVLSDIINGDSEEGAKLSQQILKESENKSSSEGPVELGRRRGVLATMINSVTSGSIFVRLAAGLNSIVGSQDAISIILIILSLLLTVGLWFFLQNMYTVVCRRIFLEGRIYETLSLQRFLHLLRVKKWVKVSWAMFVKILYNFFWAFTIVGGVIKWYAYRMVPYILAENPDLTARQAITLSRNMMKGNKWNCFCCDLSFLGWDILAICTFGLLDIFFVTPYQQAFFSEYYTQLRKKAIDGQLPGYEYLNDTYLFEKAPSDMLFEHYADVVDVLYSPTETPEKRTGLRAFFANFLGIVFLTSEKERRYEDWEASNLRIHVLKNSLEGHSYPGRLSPIPEHNKRMRIETVNYLRHYTVWSLILMFFIFSFLGWTWEVSLHLISDGEFVNRGVLHGPWLPIYGGGGVLILTLLYRFRKNPAILFLTTVILCGCVEYFSSLILELTHNGQKWWDYSGYFLNLNGRICSEGLLVFGVGGMAIVYVLAPLLDNYVKRIPKRYIAPICIVLCCLFVADFFYSNSHPNTGHGITDYESRHLPEAKEFHV